MPKMKTSKTAAKRFKKTGTGKLRRQQQNRQHLFEKKSSSRTVASRVTATSIPATRRRSSASSPSADITETEEGIEMARVKRGVASKKRHKKVLTKAKGYYGNKSRSFRAANEQVMRSGNYAFRDRRARRVRCVASGSSASTPGPVSTT